MGINCAVQNCKSKSGGWLDVSWKDKKDKHFRTARVSLCKKHFNKIYPRLKEIEKKECKKNEFWAFAPLDEVNKILNS